MGGQAGKGAARAGVGTAGVESHGQTLEEPGRNGHHRRRTGEASKSRPPLHTLGSSRKEQEFSLQKQDVYTRWWPHTPPSLSQAGDWGSVYFIQEATRNELSLHACKNLQVGVHDLQILGPHGWG